MTSRIDSYKHLDRDTSMTMSLSMEQIARECVNLNYGAHRLLSAMVHAIRERDRRFHEKHGGPEESELADGIEALLNRGLY